MSKYTTQVRWIVEEATASSEGLPIYQRIQQACPKIFNFDYPIWNEEYKTVLETKILMHYFNKEIGMETVGLWKLYLQERLNLIMPFYNQLYATTVKDYDYLSDVDYTETYDQNKSVNANYEATGNEAFKGNGTSSADTTIDQKSKTLESDLPQANYANLDYGTNLTEGETTANNNETSTMENTSTNDTSQKGTNMATTDDQYVRTKKGASGGRSITEMLIQYRDALLNIDKMIIDELADLFMLIY